MSQFSDLDWFVAEIWAASRRPLNPFSDLDLFVQAEQAWAAARNLKHWPRAFFSRDGRLEFSISEGAW
jgi:hypothetical protein